MEKGPRNANQIVAIFFSFVPVAAILDVKMAAIFSMFFAYIASSKPQNPETTHFLGHVRFNNLYHAIITCVSTRN